MGYSQTYAPYFTHGKVGWEDKNSGSHVYAQGKKYERGEFGQTIKYSYENGEVQQTKKNSITRSYSSQSTGFVDWYSSEYSSGSMSREVSIHDAIDLSGNIEYTSREIATIARTTSHINYKGDSTFSSSRNVTSSETTWKFKEDFNTMSIKVSTSATTGEGLYSTTTSVRRRGFSIDSDYNIRADTETTSSRIFSVTSQTTATGFLTTWAKTSATDHVPDLYGTYHAHNGYAFALPASSNDYIAWEVVISPKVTYKQNDPEFEAKIWKDSVSVTITDDFVRYDFKNTTVQTSRFTSDTCLILKSSDPISLYKGSETTTDSGGNYSLRNSSSLDTYTRERYTDHMIELDNYVNFYSEGDQSLVDFGGKMKYVVEEPMSVDFGKTQYVDPNGFKTSARTTEIYGETEDVRNQKNTWYTIKDNVATEDRYRDIVGRGDAGFRDHIVSGFNKVYKNEVYSSVKNTDAMHYTNGFQNILHTPTTSGFLPGRMLGMFGGTSTRNTDQYYVSIDRGRFNVNKHNAELNSWDVRNGDDVFFYTSSSSTQYGNRGYTNVFTSTIHGTPQLYSLSGRMGYYGSSYVSNGQWTSIDEITQVKYVTTEEDDVTDSYLLYVTHQRSDFSSEQITTSLRVGSPRATILASSPWMAYRNTFTYSLYGFSATWSSSTAKSYVTYSAPQESDELYYFNPKTYGGVEGDRYGWYRNSVNTIFGGGRRSNTTYSIYPPYLSQTFETCVIGCVDSTDRHKYVNIKNNATHILKKWYEPKWEEISRIDTFSMPDHGDYTHIRLYKPRETTSSEVNDYRNTGEYTIGGVGGGIIHALIKTTPEWTVGKNKRRYIT